VRASWNYAFSAVFNSFQFHLQRKIMALSEWGDTSHLTFTQLYRPAFHIFTFHILLNTIVATNHVFLLRSNTTYLFLIGLIFTWFIYTC